MKTINNLTIGDIVQVDGELSRVAECVHGNLYYAYIGHYNDKDINRYITQEEIDTAISVNNSNVNNILCCG